MAKPKNTEPYEDETDFASECLASGDYTYDDGEGILTVQMVKGGGEYSYEMSKRQYRYLRDECESPGAYFNRKLKGNEI